MITSKDASSFENNTVDIVTKALDRVGKEVFNEYQILHRTNIHDDYDEDDGPVGTELFMIVGSTNPCSLIDNEPVHHGPIHKRAVLKVYPDNSYISIINSIFNIKKELISSVSEAKNTYLNRVEKR